MTTQRTHLSDATNVMRSKMYVEVVVAAAVIAALFGYILVVIVLRAQREHHINPMPPFCYSCSHHCPCQKGEEIKNLQSSKVVVKWNKR